MTKEVEDSYEMHMLLHYLQIDVTRTKDKYLTINPTVSQYLDIELTIGLLTKLREDSWDDDQ